MENGINKKALEKVLYNFGDSFKTVFQWLYSNFEVHNSQHKTSFDEN